MADRPEEFELTPLKHSLKKGLVFAGLGRFTKSLKYHDSSLFGNSGTLASTDPASDWVFSPELGRWGIRTDGLSKVVRVPHASSLNITVALTVAGWIKAADPGGSGAIIARHDINSNRRQWLIGSSTSASATNKTVVQLSAAGTLTKTYESSLAAWDDTLRHVAFTFQANVLMLFAGGNEDTSVIKVLDTATNTLNSTERDLMIGCYLTNNTPTAFMAGLLIDPLIYARVLSLGEIQTLADRSDPTLDGLIVGTRRRNMFAVSGMVPPPATLAWLGAIKRQQVIGGGVI